MTNKRYWPNSIQNDAEVTVKLVINFPAHGLLEKVGRQPFHRDSADKFLLFIRNTSSFSIGISSAANSSCPKFETLNDCRYHYIYVNRIDIERKGDLRCGGSAVLVGRAGENGGRSHTLCKDETTELLPYKLQE